VVAGPSRPTSPLPTAVYTRPSDQKMREGVRGLSWRDGWIAPDMVHLSISRREIKLWRILFWKFGGDFEIPQIRGKPCSNAISGSDNLFACKPMHFAEICTP